MKGIAAKKSRNTNANRKKNADSASTTTTKTAPKRSTQQGSRKKNGETKNKTAKRKDSNSSNSSADTFASNLSEFMTTDEEEEEDKGGGREEEELSEFTNEKIVKVLSTIFPLDTIDPADITLNQCLESNQLNITAKQYTFAAKYNELNVCCTCISPYDKSTSGQDEFYYAFQMSKQLISCRNMASYLGVFIKANVEQMLPKEEVQNELPATASEQLVSMDQPALFIVKPWFQNGSLSTYLEQKRFRPDAYIEPLYVLQMAITLFGMLSDAHDQDIALVDFNLDSFCVGDDEGLYFNGFEHCVFLDRTFPTHQKPWINVRELVQLCPESEEIIKGNSTYKKSMDVFLASNLVLEIMKDTNYRKNQSVKKRILYRENEKQFSVIREAIDPRHAQLIEIIEQGLSYNPKNRPTASDILYWLETVRYKSIATAASEK